MPYHFQWAAIPRTWPELARGLHITLEIAAVALVGGLLLGGLIAICRMSHSRVQSAFARVYVTAFRSVPVPVVLLGFFLFSPQVLAMLLRLPPNTDIRLISAIIAFSLFEAAYYAEIIRAGVYSVPAGQSDAALALGMSRWQCLRLVVLPQALRIALPMLVTQAIILFQDTSLVYVIGLGDFFTLASNAGARDGTTTELILFAGACYFCVCTAMSAVVHRLQQRLGTAGRARQAYAVGMVLETGVPPAKLPTP